MELPMRDQVEKELTWDLTLIYPSEEAFLKDIEEAKEMCSGIASDYRGRLTTPEAIAACVARCMDVLQKMERITNYAELSEAVDYTDNVAAQRADNVRAIAAESRAQLSFVEVEILQAGEGTIRAAIELDADNGFYLEMLLRTQTHRLGAEAEKVLAGLQKTLEAPFNLYHAVKLADMKFAPFTVNGRKYPLDYSLFENNYEYDSDPQVRRAAFSAFSAELEKYENTTAAIYNTHAQTEKTLATVRGFDSVFDSLLFAQRSDTVLYNRQIELIMEHLAPHMQKYARLLQRVHGLDKMTYADLKMPLDPDYSPSVTLEQAEEMIADGLSVMGEDYSCLVHEAFEHRWVDFARNQGKETGGFCSPLYRRNSFILMTWNNRMSDVMTLAHELGHAANFRRMGVNCPYYNTIAGLDLTAEAPSTTNELIMEHYLLKKSPDKRFRRWVLSCMITNTFYHNFVTHFIEAAWQREVYRIIDAGGSLQADILNELMRKTLKKFWGDAVELNEGAELTWMRQPHYYMGLYSYTYSFGLMIGTQAVLRMEREGAAAVEDWKKALACGGETSAAQFAAYAGADITTEKPLMQTIEYIGSIIDELETLTEELEEEKGKASQRFESTF